MPDEMNAGPIVWDLATSTKLWSQGLAAAGSALGQFANVVRSTNFLMIAGWAALGIAAFKAAQKAVGAIVGIDSALREVATLLPETAEQMGVLRRELIALSTQVPQPPELLTQATYQAISAGFTDLGDALQIVATGARAAVAGLTDTETAVDVITTALNAYQLSASEAGRVSDIFFKTVEQGKIRFGELASNFGTTATSAALAGVSLEEINAAIATLTKFGINAAESTTSLNRAILSIIKPTKAQTEAAAKYGVELNATALETKGFTGVLRDLEEATEGNVEALAEIFPNIRAARSVFVLAGNGADEYRRILLQVSNSSGATQAAFEDMNGSLENQRALLANNINALWASMGAKLLPAVLDITKVLNLAFESQAETLRRLAEEQGDYARATELAAEAEEKRLAKELNTLESRFKVLQETARLRSRYGDTPAEQLESRFGEELAGILTQTFNINDGWESIEDQLQRATAAAKDQLNTLTDTNRLSPDLELSIRTRIELYGQLLQVAQAFLANEQQLGERTDADTPEERAVARAQERLNALREFAPPGSDIIKQAEETLRIAKARASIAEAEKRQRLLLIDARAQGLKLAELDLKSASELVAEEQKRYAQQNALRGLTEEEKRVARERLQIQIDYIGALIQEKTVREALAGDPAPSSDAIDRFRQMNLELQKYFEELQQTPLLEQFLEGLTGIERAIALENIEAARQKLEEWIELAARAQREGWTAVMNDLNEEVEELEPSIERQAQLLKQWINAGLQGDDLVDLMKEFGVDVDDVAKKFPELAAAIRAAMNRRPVDELLDSLSLLVRGLGEFSNALGVIGNDAIRALNQVVTLTDGVRGLTDAMKQMSAGTYVGGVAGLLGPIGGIIGGVAGLVSLGSSLFGGGPSPEEVRRVEVMKENTDAILRLKLSVDRQIAALEGLQSSDFAAVADALRAVTDVGGVDGLLREYLRGASLTDLTPRSFEEILTDLGIDLDALERAAEAVGVELPLDDARLFVEALKDMGEALRGLDLSILRESYEGAQNWARLVADVFDEELTPQKEFEILRESLRNAIPLDLLENLQKLGDDAPLALRALAKQFDFGALFGDIDDPATVQAWEDFSRYLVENFDKLFQEGFFGSLTTDEAMALLADIDSNTDAMQELLAGDDAAGKALTTVAQQNKVTTEQADILIAQDSTRNFYLMQIRDTTSEMLEAMTGGALLTAPLQSQFDRFADAKGGVYVENLDLDVTVDGAGEPTAVAVAVVDEVDKRLGRLTRTRTRGTGAAPRRNR